MPAPEPVAWTVESHGQTTTITRNGDGGYSISTLDLLPARFDTMDEATAKAHLLNADKAELDSLRERIAQINDRWIDRSEPAPVTRVHV